MAVPFVSLIPKPKEEKKFSKLFNLLFYAPFVLFIIACGIYFFLDNSLGKSTKSFEDLEATLQSQRTPEKTALEDKVFAFKQKIKDFDLLFSQHQYTSNILTILEKYVHPKAFFTDLQYTPLNSKLIVIGKTSDFKILGEQLLIFKGDKNITDASLNNAKTNSKGQVEFTIQLTFDPKFLLTPILEEVAKKR